MDFPYDIEELLQEEYESGGNLYCYCGNDTFVEPDGQVWCENCQKAINQHWA